MKPRFLQRRPRRAVVRSLFRPNLETLEDRRVPVGVNLQDFAQPNDIIGVGKLFGAPQRVILLNADTTPGAVAVTAFKHISGEVIATYNHPTGNFAGFTDPSDVTLVGDAIDTGIFLRLLVPRDWSLALGAIDLP